MSAYKKLWVFSSIAYLNKRKSFFLKNNAIGPRVHLYILHKFLVDKMLYIPVITQQYVQCLSGNFSWFAIFQTSQHYPVIVHRVMVNSLYVYLYLSNCGILKSMETRDLLVYYVAFYFGKIN